VSHCEAERFAWFACPAWLAELGLSGTEASAPIAQIVTGPSGSPDASTLQPNVAFLAGPVGTLQACEIA